jgi:hypothetical protein
MLEGLGLKWFRVCTVLPWSISGRSSPDDSWRCERRTCSESQGGGGIVYGASKRAQL